MEKVKELEFLIKQQEAKLNTVKYPPLYIITLTVVHFCLMQVGWSYNTGIIFFSNFVLFLWLYKSFYANINKKIAIPLSMAVL